MNKKIVWLLSVFLILTSINALAAGVDKLEPIGKDTSSARVARSSTSARSNVKNRTSQSKKAPVVLDKDTVYYPNANINSVIAKYKDGNYTGCLQELFSLIKKEPDNALAYYYMAMAYTYVDMEADAIEAYEKVLALSPNTYLAEYALKGRDCLTGGPACQTVESEELSDLDKFILSPYGNGLSPELNQQVQQHELTNIKETINKKERLEDNDVEKIKKFDDKYKSFSIDNEKIAQVSDEEILQAVKTLKDAGLNVTLQGDNPYSMPYQNPQMAEMSMMLGGNNNNGNAMMNMVPMLMSQAQKGENIDPRVMQALMMNSMMSDFGYMNNNNNNNNY